MPTGTYSNSNYHFQWYLMNCIYQWLKQCKIGLAPALVSQWNANIHRTPMSSVPEICMLLLCSSEMCRYITHCVEVVQWSIGPHLPVKMYKRLPCKLPIHMASHDWPRNVNWILWYWQNPHKRSSVTIELSHCFCVFTPEANKGPEKTESRSPKTDRLNITPPPTHAQLQSSRWDRCATRESLWVYRPWSHKVEMGQKCEGMLWKHGYHNSYFVLSCFLSIHYSC